MQFKSRAREWIPVGAVESGEKAEGWNLSYKKEVRWEITNLSALEFEFGTARHRIFKHHLPLLAPPLLESFASWLSLVVPSERPSTSRAFPINPAAAKMAQKLTYL